MALPHEGTLFGTLIDTLFYLIKRSLFHSTRVRRDY